MLFGWMIKQMSTTHIQQLMIMREKILVIVYMLDVLYLHQKKGLNNTETIAEQIKK